MGLNRKTKSTEVHLLCLSLKCINVRPCSCGVRVRVLRFTLTLIIIGQVRCCFLLCLSNLLCFCWCLWVRVVSWRPTPAAAYHRGVVLQPLSASSSSSIKAFHSSDPVMPVPWNSWTTALQTKTFTGKPDFAPSILTHCSQLWILEAFPFTGCCHALFPKHGKRNDEDPLLYCRPQDDVWLESGGHDQLPSKVHLHHPLLGTSKNGVTLLCLTHSVWLDKCCYGRHYFFPWVLFAATLHLSRTMASLARTWSWHHQKHPWVSASLNPDKTWCRLALLLTKLTSNPLG